MAAGIAASGCVPVQPSEHELVGTWRVVWACGTESLDLRADTTYTQEIVYGDGGRATHSGAWAVERRKSRPGAAVVLKDAVVFCTTLGKRLPEPTRTDRRLEAKWEWGRVMLSFSSDLEGFVRQ